VNSFPAIEIKSTKDRKDPRIQDVEIEKERQMMLH
jgi:hypothetical protein